MSTRRRANRSLNQSNVSNLQRCSEFCQENKYKKLLKVKDNQIKLKNDILQGHGNALKTKDDEIDKLKQDLENVKKKLDDAIGKYGVCQHLDVPKMFVKCSECTDDSLRFQSKGHASKQH